MAKRKNESGQVTLDFLYGAILILGCTVLLSALAIVLSMAEVYQYIAFSAARAYFAADITPSDQANAATNKAQALLGGLPFLQQAQANKWVKVVSNKSGDFSSYAQGLGIDPTTYGRNQFTGYQLKFSAPLLDLNLPLIGNAVQPPNGGFQATVSSFLMREPTEQECEAYNQSIFQFVISQSQGTFSQTINGAASSNSGASFVPINDNGC